MILLLAAIVIAIGNLWLFRDDPASVAVSALALVVGFILLVVVELPRRAKNRGRR